MELKRIIARDSRSANEKAIQMYGPDVLIISSQRVDQQTELIVAVDVASEAEQPLANAPSALTSPAQDVSFQADKDASLPFAEVFQNANSQAATDLAQENMAQEAADLDLQTAQEAFRARSLPAQPQAVVTPAPAPGEAALHLAAIQAARYEQQRSQEIVEMLRQEPVQEPVERRVMPVLGPHMTGIPTMVTADAGQKHRSKQVRQLFDHAD